jgi:hypothetical protein
MTPAPEDGTIDPELEIQFTSAQMELVEAWVRVAHYKRLLDGLIKDHPELAAIPSVSEFPLLDLRTDYGEPESIRRRERIEKLIRHIDKAKKTGKGFKSKTAFCKSLHRAAGGAGIDRNEYYDWARGIRMDAPGHARIIEEAIDAL